MLTAALLALLPQALPAVEASPQEPAAPHPGRLVVLNKAEATASVLDLGSGEVVATLETGDGPHEVALHPDGRWAVVADYGAQRAGSTLTVLDLEELRRARVIELGEAVRPHGLVFEPDGASLWLTAETVQQLWRVDFEKGEVLVRATTGQRASHMVARAPSGRLFVANIGSNNVTPVEGDGTVLEPIATGAGAEGGGRQPGRAPAVGHQPCRRHRQRSRSGHPEALEGAGVRQLPDPGRAHAGLAPGPGELRALG